MRVILLSDLRVAVPTEEDRKRRIIGPAQHMVRFQQAARRGAETFRPGITTEETHAVWPQRAFPLRSPRIIADRVPFQHAAG